MMAGTARIVTVVDVRDHRLRFRRAPRRLER
jgi:hypothetical protein